MLHVSFWANEEGWLYQVPILGAHGMFGLSLRNTGLCAAGTPAIFPAPCYTFYFSLSPSHLQNISPSKTTRLRFSLLLNKGSISGLLPWTLQLVGSDALSVLAFQ